MITITQGATTIQPELVTGYETVRQSATTVHRIIDRAEPDATLQAAGGRTGTLEMWCSTYLVALAVEEIHTRTGVLALANDEAPGQDMTYVVDGELRVRPEWGTPRWLVTVAYAEVAT